MDFPGNIFTRMFKTHAFGAGGAGGAGALTVYFPDLSKDMFLEVQNEKCS